MSPDEEDLQDVQMESIVLEEASDGECELSAKFVALLNADQDHGFRERSRRSSGTVLSGCLVVRLQMPR